jgi:hypothetical protein
MYLAAERLMAGTLRCTTRSGQLTVDRSSLKCVGEESVRGTALPSIPPGYHGCDRPVCREGARNGDYFLNKPYEAG